MAVQNEVLQGHYLPLYVAGRQPKYLAYGQGWQKQSDGSARPEPLRFLSIAEINKWL